MRITKTQLRQIIREEIMREALNPEDVDWQNLRTMKPGDVYDLPPEQQSLAQTMISTRDRAGRKVGAARWESQSAKIFEIIDALRESLDYKSWRAKSREIIMSSDEFTQDIATNLIDEINGDLKNIAKLIRYENGYFSASPHENESERTERSVASSWPYVKDWAFREAMAGQTVKEYNRITGKNLFADAAGLRTGAARGAKEAVAYALRKRNEQAAEADAQEKKNKSWF